MKRHRYSCELRAFFYKVLNIGLFIMLIQPFLIFPGFMKNEYVFILC